VCAANVRSAGDSSVSCFESEFAETLQCKPGFVKSLQQRYVTLWSRLIMLIWVGRNSDGLINLPLRGESFLRLLRNSQHLWASIGGLYLFNLVAFGGQTTNIAFTLDGGIAIHIFNSPYLLLTGSDKIRGYNNGTDLRYNHGHHHKFVIVIVIVKTICNAHKVNAKHRIGGAGDSKLLEIVSRTRAVDEKVWQFYDCFLFVCYFELRRW